MSVSSPPRTFNSWDAIKLMALGLMIIDHTGIVLDSNVLRALGRGAAPIFLFLAGYATSYRFHWDIFLLAITCVLMKAVMGDGNPFPLNILFTIICIRMVFNRMEIKQRHLKNPFEWYLMAISWIISMRMFEYGSFGFLFALSGYLKRNQHIYTVYKVRIFLWLSLFSYFLFLAYLAHFNEFEDFLIFTTLTAVGMLLQNFEVYEVNFRCLPSWAMNIGKQIARNSGYIYAINVMALFLFTK